MPIDYNNSKIYKIVSSNTNLIYIGSTTQELSTRLKNHISSKKCKSYDIIKLGNYKIELIESYPCNTKHELLQREGYYQKLYSDTIINSYTMIGKGDEYRQQQWRDNNKDKTREYNKMYRELKKDSIKSYMSEYYKKNRDIIIKRSTDNNTRNNIRRSINYYKRKERNSIKELYDVLPFKTEVEVKQI